MSHDERTSLESYVDDINQNSCPENWFSLRDMNPENINRNFNKTVLKSIIRIYRTGFDKNNSRPRQTIDIDLKNA